jgi:hypothetical protein
MSPLGVLNFFVIQWTGLRLARCVQPSGKVKWRVLRWVWPLTGWWGEYKWIHRVWPLHQIGAAEETLVAALAMSIALEIDQEIVNDLGETKAEEEAAWEAINQTVGHYVIYRSIESDELARDVGADKGGDISYTLMGAEVADHNLKCLLSYDPEGTHEHAVDLHGFTWKQAKMIQKAMNEVES